MLDVKFLEQMHLILPKNLRSLQLSPCKFATQQKRGLQTLKVDFRQFCVNFHLMSAFWTCSAGKWVDYVCVSVTYAAVDGVNDSLTYGGNDTMFYEWSISKVNDEWFADEENVRKTVGLLERSIVEIRPNLTCGICFETYTRGRMKAAICGHHFCDVCWAEIKDT
eukprot:Gb_37130 [translate_table: standard]